VARTLEEVSPYVRAARSGLADELQHIYLFAGHEPLELRPYELSSLDELGFTGQGWFDIDTTNAAVLTDDRTHLALLSRDLVIQHRRLCLRQRRNPPW
jgi:hypothetical protein